MAGKRVYISFAAEDAAQCNLLTAALDAWEVPYTTARPALPQGDQLPDVEKVAIRDCAVFLRLCTTATPRSYWMTFEQTAFLAMQAEEYRQSQQLRRKLINVVLDKNYQREPFDYADPIIEASDLADATWQTELHAALFSPVAA